MYSFGDGDGEWGQRTGIGTKDWRQARQDADCRSDADRREAQAKGTKESTPDTMTSDWRQGWGK